MKEITKKKMTIGVLSGVIVASLGFSIYISQDLDKSGNDKDEPKSSETVKKGEDKKEKEKTVHMKPSDEKEDPALSVNKKELSIAQIKNAESEVRNLYRQFKFDKGLDVINSLEESNKFTGDAEVLRVLQFDGALISNLNDTHSDEQNGTALINMMTGFKDPENLLLATLYLNLEVRPHVILFEGSLNPVYQETESLSVIKKTTEEIPHEIKVLYPETKTYHKITFSLEGFTLEAYILESNDGVLRFYMIQDPHNKSHYYTISQWKKINDNKEKGKPLMEGVLEMKEQSYVPTYTKDKKEEEIPNPKIEDSNKNGEETTTEK